MLKYLLPTLTIFLSACSLLNFSRKEEVPPPLPPPPITADPAVKRHNEVFYEGLKKRLATHSVKNGLKPLAETPLPSDSIEIRLSMFASFFAPIYKGLAVDDCVLVLKRDDRIWSGKIIRSVIKSNSVKEKTALSINQSPSNWESLWQKLQEKGILTPPTKSETSIKSDSALYVIESKVNENYSYFYFHSPKESSEIEEEQRVASIFNLIAKEFDFSDLKVSS